MCNASLISHLIVTNPSSPIWASNARNKEQKDEDNDWYHDGTKSMRDLAKLGAFFPLGG
jgi:hypothetical protein